MYMTIGKYLNGMWNMNNLIGNFKKQTCCLWSEGGGGTSLDSDVEQSWQESSVNFCLTVWYISNTYIHIWWESVTTFSCPPVPTPSCRRWFFQWISNVKYFGQCLLHLGCAAVQPCAEVALCGWLFVFLGEIKTFRALMMVVVGTDLILAVLWH